jgi:molybdopterin biosynthesis enzyme
MSVGYHCLTALDDVLQPVLADVSPVPPCTVPLAEAEGLRLAAPVIAPKALPAHHIALRSGLAVASLDLVGASMHSPVTLARPQTVEQGAPLRAGCDAVIDPGAVSGSGRFVEIGDQIAPGTHVRFAGHDLAEGACVAAAGARLTPERLLVCQTCGIADVHVRRPDVAFAIENPALKDWLSLRLQHLGCQPTADLSGAALVIRETRSAVPRIALQPGETAWITSSDGRVEIETPARFDGMLAAYAALILPVVARLMGQALRFDAVKLTRKLSSSLGQANLALFRIAAGHAEPLGVGDITLTALTKANAFAVIPAGTEGCAAGQSVDVVHFDDPFEAAQPDSMMTQDTT